MLADTALLVLEDGTVFEGISIGAVGETSGEVVFNTSMTGYQEILSDPSYARQIVTLTYPHVGNTGVNQEDNESAHLWLSGLVIRSLPQAISNYRSEGSLSEYLIKHGVVGICGIDTRKLTRLLRMKGSQNACLQAGEIDQAKALTRAREFPGLKGMDLAREVSTDSAYHWHQGAWQSVNGNREPPQEPYRVTAYDFGVKHNILRLLVDRGCEVTVVPADTTAEDVLSSEPDGVFLSNGPGDPEPCDYAIAAIKEILTTGLPVFGICLGHQLLGLASGAKTQKMKFGHHGANHPVQDLTTKVVHITSQNHGFAVDESSLPDNLVVSHKSLFDGSLQGIRRTDTPAFGFQGHPEASPGPHDIAPLFNQFVDLIKASKQA